MTNKIDKNKKYVITKLWITKPQQVDRSTWTYDSTPDHHHGPRMLPNRKTGQMNILMAMDARINHGTIRTGDAMVRFVINLASQVGMQNPEKVGKFYSYTWLNEGLIKEVA